MWGWGGVGGRGGVSPAPLGHLALLRLLYAGLCLLSLGPDPDQYKLLLGQVQWRLPVLSHVRLRYKSPEAAWGGPLSGNHIQRGSCRVLHPEPATPCATPKELHICTTPSLPMAFIPCLMTEAYESPKDFHQGGKSPQPRWELSCLPRCRTRQRNHPCLPLKCS